MHITAEQRQQGKTVTVEMTDNIVATEGWTKYLYSDEKWHKCASVMAPRVFHLTHTMRTIYGSLLPSEILPEGMPSNFLIAPEAFENFTERKGCIY